MTINYRKLVERIQGEAYLSDGIVSANDIERILREELGGMRVVPDWWPSKSGLPGHDDYEAKIEHDRKRIAELERQRDEARAEMRRIDDIHTKECEDHFATLARLSSLQSNRHAELVALLRAIDARSWNEKPHLQEDPRKRSYRAVYMDCVTDEFKKLGVEL